jgi:hypothetical protein
MKIYVVHYGAFVTAVTTDRDGAEKAARGSIRHIDYTDSEFRPESEGSNRECLYYLSERTGRWKKDVALITTKGLEG